jgi:hypothetical protein
MNVGGLCAEHRERGLRAADRMCSFVQRWSDRTCSLLYMFDWRCADEGDSTSPTTRPSSSRTRPTPSSASTTCSAESVYTGTPTHSATVSLCILPLLDRLTNDFLLQILKAAQNSTHSPLYTCHPAPHPVGHIIPTSPPRNDSDITVTRSRSQLGFD